jgi:hypothetical protein
MGAHPLHGRRHRGQRIEPDALTEQLRAAKRLRDHLLDDREAQLGISTDYTSELYAYALRYQEHWARILGHTPFDFPELAGGVEPGWQPLLGELDLCLQAIDPGYYVEQVKQKFGALRVYVISLGGSELSAQLSDAVAEFEQRSITICEDCGRPGTRRDVGGGCWRTVCDVHVRR